MELTAGDILDGFAGGRKRYGNAGAIAGVETLPLQRHVDDRGLFLEIYRNRATHSGSEHLASFFKDVEVAQLNFSLVTVADHVKGLHYHLKQSDVWLCPPPYKLKMVMLDVRRDSPTSGVAQVLVLGEGRDAWVKVPPGVAHGYRPLTLPCGLFYVVSRCFDLDDPDEYRIPWDHPAVKDLWSVKND
ncbi:MAG TPA: dTDP-4-dehydrorhamnose 3,5-epimerase family protein [Thermoanaerobaculaceae bacterium]|nr:dTDP-4-dehydrorhamnose 3,5-epimerase family protein [Thermoanaerobaculaceae bacterium]